MELSCKICILSTLNDPEKDISWKLLPCLKVRKWNLMRRTNGYDACVFWLGDQHQPFSRFQKEIHIRVGVWLTQVEWLKTN